MEVWRFGDSRRETTRERLTDRLPVRLRGDVLGEIDLGEAFRRG